MSLFFCRSYGTNRSFTVFIRRQGQMGIRDGPRPGDDVVKHEGYATQWYGLSLAAALLWLWATLKSRRTRHPVERPH